MKSSCKLLIYSLVVMISGRKLLIYGYSCYAKSVSFYKTTFTVSYSFSPVIELFNGYTDVTCRAVNF